MQRAKSNRVYHLPELDSLRGIMALWVLVGHVLQTFNFSAQDFLPVRLLEENVAAVDIFMILSGFVIFHLLEIKQEPYPLYVKRRILRLWPAYILCFFIMILIARTALDALAMLPLPTLHDVDRERILQSSFAFIAPHIFAHMAMLHGLVPNAILPNSDFAFMGQGWSISLELQFYLLAPLAMKLLSGKRRWWIVLAALLALLHALKGMYGMGFIGSHVHYFALGVVSYYAWKNSARWNKYLARWWSALILAVPAAIVLLMPKYWHVAIWACVLIQIIAIRCDSKERLVTVFDRFLKSEALKFLGAISYSIYLSHMIVFYMILRIAVSMNLANGWMVGTCLASTFVVTILLSATLHRFVERPCIEWGRKLR